MIWILLIVICFILGSIADDVSDIRRMLNKDKDGKEGK